MPSIMKIVRRLALYAGAFIGAALLVLVAVRAFAPQPADDLPVPAEQAPFAEGRAEGGEQFDFRVRDEDTPRTHDERMRASSLSLIAERQARPDPPIQATPDEAAQIGALIDRFIPAWETFTPGMSEAAYRARLAPYAVPSALSAMVAREGANQPADIGTCRACANGSRYDRTGFTPSDMMVIRALDDSHAYVTTKGTITYAAGPRANTQAQRTYALLLERSGDRWLVGRIAADTLE